MFFRKPFTPGLALLCTTLLSSIGLYHVTETAQTPAVHRTSTWASIVSEGSIFRATPARPRVVAPVVEQIKDPYKALVKTEAAQGLVAHIQDHYSLEKKTAEKIIASVFRHSDEHKVEPALVFGIIDRESSFRMDARSSVGAMGLMQVWPKWHQEKIKEAAGTEDKLWEADFNIRIGTKILREYLDRSDGRLTEALARYNGSLGKNNGYPDKVLKSRERYKPYVKPLLQAKL